ncbi:MAG TPA: F0F1 ATP synthase subunit delta [Jiangellaceae bacterium]|nr:F0F1 ATP synthase subunit delta [Jiangellaceae bacterium]
MRGPGREAYAAFDERLQTAVGGSADAAAAVGAALFTVADLLREQPAVRRALTDIGRSPDDRETLARTLLRGRTDPAAVDLVAAAARDRWDGGRTFASAIEEFGVVALLSAADQRDVLDHVEDELFRFGQVVRAEPALRNALLDQAAPVDSRRGLVRTLLSERVTAETLQVVEHVVLGRRGRTLEAALDHVGELAAARRRRRVAVIRVAAPLTTRHRERLEQVLAAQTGGPVHLNVVVEPDMVGGVKVEIGDEVVDGTVRSRLADVERQLAGR